MGRKKNLKGIDPEDQELIAMKMGGHPAPDLMKSINLSNAFRIDIKCKNEKQKTYLKQIKDPEKEICFGIGSAGTGKSIIAMSAALALVKDLSNDFKKIVVFIPTAECVSKSLSLGYLKGTLEDKTGPYLEMVKQNIEKVLKLSGNGYNSKSIADYLVASGIIEFQFLNFCKGKTFEESILYVDECEDFSKEDLLLLLTRKGGRTCKVICMGDDKQISRQDLRKNRNDSGLKFASEILEDMPEVAVTRFGNEDIVRDPLLTEIINRFEDPEGYRERKAKETVEKVVESEVESEIANNVLQNPFYINVASNAMTNVVPI